MNANDSEPTRGDVELTDRYDSVTDCTGRTLVYDLENPDAWIRSDAVVDIEDRQ